MENCVQAKKQKNTVKNFTGFLRKTRCSYVPSNTSTVNNKGAG